MRRDARRWGLGALVLLAVAAVPLVAAAVMWVPERELARGPLVSAEVVEVLSVRTTSKGPPDTSAVRVRFTTEDGQEVTTVMRSTRTVFDSRTTLRYDPDDPTRVRAELGPEQAWRVPLIVGGSVLAVGLFLLWQAFRLRVGRPSRLYRKWA
jgi:hypothetical protein